MRNIKLIIQYEGTRYRGWQSQESTDNTIQGKLEVLLEKMCKEKVELFGSGRTDAGVHALAQVANFHTNSDMSTQDMLHFMNEYLPQDIGITAVTEASPRFHSRLNVRGKKYCYHIINSEIPNVFWQRYALTVPEKLDCKAMEEGAAYLVGEHDFKAFTSTKKGKKSTIRKIEEIKIEKKDDLIEVNIIGSGFLHHMVRIMMGTFLRIGKGEMQPEEIRKILRSEKRENAGELVPAKGLMLVEAYYQ